MSSPPEDTKETLDAARSAWIEAATTARGVRSPELDRLWRKYLDALCGQIFDGALYCGTTKGKNHG